MMFPVVRDLAADGVPVTVSCRVLKLCRQQYYRWRSRPFTDAELDEAWVANAICDALKEYGVRHIDMPVTSQKIWKALNSNSATMR